MNSKKIIFKVRKQIFGELSGNNPSILKGEGYDFIELREYNNGDDIRKIDWNITAKLNSPHVKVFREEREINVVAVSLLGGSTYFGGQVLKQETIAEIVALLGFSTTKNMDTFSSYIFAEKEYIFERASKKYRGVERGVENIVNFSPFQKGIDGDFVVKTLLERVKRKSLIFIISDFYTPLDLKLLSKHSQVVVVKVRDKIEENPPPFGFVTLVDSENGDRVEADFSNNSSYKMNLRNHDFKLYENWRKWGVRYLEIENGLEIYSTFRKFFNT
jgi:uncharacterized protein (DUF58 family)